MKVQAVSIAEQDRNGVQVIRRAAQILDALKRRSRPV